MFSNIKPHLLNFSKLVFLKSKCVHLFPFRRELFRYRYRVINISLKNTHTLSSTVETDLQAAMDHS